VVILISRPLLSPHALLVAPPLVLDRDGSLAFSPWRRPW
jgi:hypothetical protein